MENKQGEGEAWRLKILAREDNDNNGFKAHKRLL